jgi:hypothetical protein
MTARGDDATETTEPPTAAPEEVSSPPADDSGDAPPDAYLTDAGDAGVSSDAAAGPSHVPPPLPPDAYSSGPSAVPASSGSVAPLLSAPDSPTPTVAARMERVPPGPTAPEPPLPEPATHEAEGHVSASATAPRGAVAGSGWRWLPPPPELPSCPPGLWGDDPDGVSAGLADGATARFIAASVRGRSHRQDGSPCDDAFALLKAGGWRGVLVSDGAGSARFSRVGARLACARAERVLAQALADVDLSSLELAEADLPDLLRDPWSDPNLESVFEAFQRAFAAADEAITAWVDEVNRGELAPSPERIFLRDALALSGRPAEPERWSPGEEERPPRVLRADCHCTLLVAVLGEVRIRKQDGNVRRTAIAVTCSVGDGMMAVFRNLAPWAVPLMSPDAGAYAGQTRFLSREYSQAEAIRSRLRLSVVGRVEDVLGLAAMTDGVGDDYAEDAGMDRLLCDLFLNRVLPPGEGVSVPVQHQVAAAITRQEAIVTPEEHGRTVLVRYAARHAEVTGLSARQMLETDGVLQGLCALDPVEGTVDGAPAEAARRLKTWLEAYHVRGSFDDRTLALFAAGARQ